MSSREIAQLTGSSHENVLKTIRALIKRGIVSPNEAPYTHAQNGQTYPEFLLNYRDTMVVVSGYSVELRAKIIDHWQDLEAWQAGVLQIPSNYAEALRLAAEQVERNLLLQQQIAQQAPKVAAIKRLAGAQGAICITDAAKQLQLAPSSLFAWLQEYRWIFRRKGSKRWIGYQPRIHAGWIIHKVTALKPDLETGAEHAAFDLLITPRGLAVLAEKVPGAKL
ncbi:phage regulatory protein/antirepressor Ant [Pseudomonas sp. RIT-PI-S]|uniref:Rha family transcriptional regulator n=1 Tax=Pseudomonas sp. RIT-PI-S TaxID=3035295 RepID=UPI0021DB2566|nr:phage regulatory protein/antirepressor Ant [Pseudomonas sp. RIT-PI-S]